MIYDGNCCCSSEDCRRFGCAARRTQQRPAPPPPQFGQQYYANVLNPPDFNRLAAAIEALVAEMQKQRA